MSFYYKSLIRKISFPRSSSRSFPKVKDKFKVEFRAKSRLWVKVISKVKVKFRVEFWVKVKVWVKVISKVKVKVWVKAMSKVTVVVKVNVFVCGCMCLLPLASPRGAWGAAVSPSVPRMGREIRANPMSFLLGGTPYVVWHFSLKVLLSCYNLCFLFKDENCALHNVFINKKKPSVFCFSYLQW